MDDLFFKKIQNFTNHEEKWSKCVIVTGTGGARTDFVCGWLSHVLPCLSTLGRTWLIDPYTGRSQLNNSFYFLNDFLINDHEIGQQCANWLLERYSSFSDKYLIQKTHRHASTCVDKIFNYIGNKFVIINITGENNLETAVNITWEFLIKTFFPKNINNFKIWLSDNINIEIDNNIGDERFADLVMTDVMNCLIKVSTWSQIAYNHENVINIPYRDLLTHNGKNLLADFFKIELNDLQKNMWDNCLNIAKTPDIIDAVGVTWKKQDIEDRILEHYPDITRS